jgi:hypothetical protein
MSPESVVMPGDVQLGYSSPTQDGIIKSLDLTLAQVHFSASNLFCFCPRTLHR